MQRAFVKFKKSCRKMSPLKIYNYIGSLFLLLLWYNVFQFYKTCIQQYMNGPPTDDFDDLLVEKQEIRSGKFFPKNIYNLKFILKWNHPTHEPFGNMKSGQKYLSKIGCQFVNCFFTSDRYYLNDYTLFDAIIFNGPEVLGLPRVKLPTERSDMQKYVFATIESSHYYPLCSNRFDGYFNWTWTYHLDSDSGNFIIVRDMQNKIIGPNKTMHWMKLADMKPVSKEFKHNLSSKTMAAAWFVSNCATFGQREKFIRDLRNELAYYRLTIDTYGACGTLSCPSGDKKCDELIRTTYYFYLAFENSFSEDYVTEKLLHGLRNNAVPIVFGGANYTRFMPDGIYLNALELGVYKLAKKMRKLIRDPDMYAEYFKWKNHYTYHHRNDNTETNDYCKMCAFLNNGDMIKKKSGKQNFRDWWDIMEC